MIISNEPGYYKAGAYGIRIENLVAGDASRSRSPAATARCMGFETLTLAPIDRRLIAAAAAVAARSIAWLDAYHLRVYGALSGWPTLTAEERGWLEAACRPVVG